MERRLKIIHLTIFIVYIMNISVKKINLENPQFELVAISLQGQCELVSIIVPT